MSEPKAEKQTEPKLGWFDIIEMLGKHPRIAAIIGFVAVVSVWGFYLWQFRFGLSDSQETWGQFGDFVGGTLNSVFGFLGFLILLSSLRLQARELEETRRELKTSSEAQKMQAEHLSREAQKKDHTDAIIYIMNFGKIDLYDFAEYMRIPSNISNIEYIDEVLQSGNEELRLLAKKVFLFMELDYHCAELKMIFPKSPLLLEISLELEKTSIYMRNFGYLTEPRFFTYTT